MVFNLCMYVEERERDHILVGISAHVCMCGCVHSCVCTCILRSEDSQVSYVRWLLLFTEDSLLCVENVTSWVRLADKWVPGIVSACHGFQSQHCWDHNHAPPMPGFLYEFWGSQVLRLDRQAFADRAIAQLAMPVLRKPEQTSVVRS